MASRYFLSALLLALTITTSNACSADSPVETVEPVSHDPVACDTCVAGKIDLRMDTAYVISGIVRDSARHRDVLAPGPMRIVVRVTNAADSVPPETHIFFSGGTVLASDSGKLRIPSMAPGAVHTDTISVDVPASYASPLSTIRTLNLTVFVSAIGDPVFANNSKHIPAYYVSKGVFVLTRPANIDVRANEAFSAPVTIRNDGYVSTPAVTLSACLDFGWSMCGEWWTAFATFVVPALAPGQTIQIADSLRFSGQNAFQDERFEYFIELCPGSDAQALYRSGPCMSAGSATVRPDYDGTCHPPLLSTGATVTLSTRNCGYVAPASTDSITTAVHESDRFHLVAIDLEAGRTYRLDRTSTGSPPRVYDVTGVRLSNRASAANEIRIDAAGHFYVVLYDVLAAQTLTLVAL